MAASAQPNVGLRALAAAKRRFGRLRPGRVDKGLLWVVILCWVATSVLSLLILSGSAERDGDLDVLDRWLSEIGGSGAASAAFVAALTLQATKQRRWFNRALRIGAVALLAGFPFIALSASGLTILSSVAGVGLVSAVVSYVLASTHHRTTRVAAIIAAGSVLVAWVALVLTLFQATADTRPLLITSFTLGALSTLFVNLTGVAAVLLIAAPRRARLEPLIRRPASRWIVLAVAATVISIVVARLTFARYLFGTADAGIWTLWEPDGIPHAIITAVVLYAVVAASVNHPYRPAGRLLVSWILILSVSAGAILLSAITIIGSFRAVAVGIDEVRFDVVATALLGLEITVLGVLSTAVFLFGRRRPRSIGFAIALVALVYTLFVAFVRMAALTIDRSAYEFPYWSGPVPVIIALVAIIAIRVVVAAIRNEPNDRNSAYISLLVTPIVLLHAGTLIPLFLESQLTAPLVVLGTALSLFWLMPPTAADRTRHTVTVLVASATQVALLIIWLMNERVGGAVEGEGDLMRSNGILLLALPLTVAVSAYVIRAVPAKDASLAAP
jgi:hypothetical protein